uniref:Uncharacterized protein n=1 Tax=Anguilla anguilla TaxID=7936 RepID=A0A0E9QG23_ANGAN
MDIMRLQSYIYHELLQTWILFFK